VTRDVLILGAGGHGAVVADILLQLSAAAGTLRPMGLLDDDSARHGTTVLGLPVLGGLAALAGLTHDAVILAIGHNVTRKRLYNQFTQQGEHFVTACHPRAIVAPDATLGPGSVLCAGAIVNPGCAIGANAILNTGCTVDHHNRIGDHVHIAPGVHLGGDVQIEQGAMLGIGATVLPGVHIGAWAQVGAGAVVTKNLEPGALAVGVPARTVRHVPMPPADNLAGASPDRG
jgi:sugar O-acyltransferase (sialic acid O-acetyltransferase NeuD family)